MDAFLNKLEMNSYASVRASATDSTGGNLSDDDGGNVNGNEAVKITNTSSFSVVEVDQRMASKLEVQAKQQQQQQQQQQQPQQKQQKQSQSQHGKDKGQGKEKEDHLEQLGTLESKIKEQGAKVAQLKGDASSDKDTVKQAVDELLALKNQLPEGHPDRPLSRSEKKKKEKEAKKKEQQQQQQQQQQPQQNDGSNGDVKEKSLGESTGSSSVGGVELEKLEEDIKEQGKKVAELKKQQADESQVKEEVDKLLALKNQLPEGHKDRPMSKAEKKKKEKQEKAKQQKSGSDDGKAPDKHEGTKGNDNDNSDGNNDGSSAKDLRSMKEARRAANIAKQKQAAEKRELTDTYGYLPLLQSRESDKKGRNFVYIGALTNASHDGEKVWIRGHIFASRAAGALTFATIRQGLYSVQVIVSGNKSMSKMAAKAPLESVVDVEGVVKAAPEPVQETTQQEIEIHAEKFFVVNSAGDLPLSVRDASRPLEATSNEDGEKFVGGVSQDLRLDFRWLDLRTPMSQAIFRISSGVCTLFREYLVKQGFVEVQTPKLLGGSSEGGADVFTTSYFGSKACLAQSPQLHKQILAACSGYERVFEIGPVFRAENSNTARHLCEFHGLDMEMSFYEHYHEVLDVFSDLFIYIFDGLNERFKAEIETVRKHHPFEDLRYDRKKTPVFKFADAIQLLREDGVTEEEQGSMDDLSTVMEKRVGRLVAEKYGIDFFFLDEYPLSARPFYTMPHPEKPELSNSFDFLLRTQEILSGAQRVHDPNLLEERIKEFGMDPDSVRFYINAFKHGALPHGGGGIGLERVVMLFLGLPNIRMASIFPRDPSRLSP